MEPITSYYFWETSQSDDLDQLILLCESWYDKKIVTLPLLKHYRIQPFRLMDVTDDALDYLLETRSPSPIKKAACLCYYVSQLRPLCHENPNLAYAQLEEKTINAKMAFDFASLYIKNSIFTKENNEGVISTIEVEHLPVFPSKHFMVEFIQRLAKGELQFGGICLILELLLYNANPKIAGIIDPTLKQKLKETIEGYDLSLIYSGLTSNWE